MHPTAITDRIRQRLLELDYRGRLPTEVLYHYDHVAKYVHKYYDAYRPQINDFDEAYTAVAKALVLVLITQHLVLPAWRQLWAVGPIGAIVGVYTAIRDVGIKFPRLEE
jgi:hypothetical protein